MLSIWQGVVQVIVPCTEYNFIPTRSPLYTLRTDFHLPTHGKCGSFSFLALMTRVTNQVLHITPKKYICDYRGESR